MANPLSMTATRPLIHLPDADATMALGVNLARHLRAGDTVLLVGDLGMGKTTLARGLIAALCGTDDIPSPTYTLIQSYETANGVGLLHADLYRVEDESELDELGLEDAFDGMIVLVEWPGILGKRTPDDRLQIHFEAHETGRIARMIGHGDWEDRLVGLDTNI